jgi:hypothetical protein
MYITLRKHLAWNLLHKVQQDDSQTSMIKYGTPGKSNHQVVFFGRPMITSEAIVKQAGSTFNLVANGVDTGEFEL